MTKRSTGALKARDARTSAPAPAPPLAPSLAAHDEARRAAALLAAAGLAEPGLEWRALARALPRGPAREAGLARRCRREPLAYIAGVKEFMSRDFLAGPGALVPRPESELLVEAALAQLARGGAEGAAGAAGAAGRDGTGGGWQAVEFGVGTGAVLLSLLAEAPASFALSGLGVEQAPAALALARRNADRLCLAERVLWAAEDWASAPLQQRLAEARPAPGRRLALANPPYLSTREWEAAAPEVRLHEPRGGSGRRCGRAGRLSQPRPGAGRRLGPGGGRVRGDHPPCAKRRRRRSS